jgi:hypothetical protein
MFEHPLVFYPGVRKSRKILGCRKMLQESAGKTLEFILKQHSFPAKVPQQTW